MDFAGRLSKRADDLARELHTKAGDAEKVHIIGHSMGGLDARFMIVNNPAMRGKVASLTTIGTPHWGTVFADHFRLDRPGSDISRDLAVLKPLLDLEGLEDLTTKACRAFNELAQDSEADNDVVYQTYSSYEDRQTVFSPLKPSWDIIHNSTGGDPNSPDRLNDGLVAVSSQQWQPSLRSSKSGRHKPITQKAFPFQADHLNEVGWWDLAELGNGNWNFARYERGVRDVYLEIANGVANL